MFTQESQITFQAATFTICLDQLVARFGDRLEELTTIDKLDLLAILAFWQSTDTRNLECDSQQISLKEYLSLEPGLQDATSVDLDNVLTLLADCSEGDSFTLMKTIINQLHDLRQS